MRCYAGPYRLNQSVRDEAALQVAPQPIHHSFLYPACWGKTEKRAVSAFFPRRAMGGIEDVWRLICRPPNVRRKHGMLLAGSWLSLVAACQSVDTEQTTTMNAVVETVDPVSRELLLRGSGGAQSGLLLSTVVSPRVQRLEQIVPVTG
jgi:hypothetical protein